MIAMAIVVVYCNVSSSAFINLKLFNSDIINKVICTLAIA